MAISLKIHLSGNKKVIAICDYELLGKKFEEDSLQLNLNERFLKGELLEKGEFSKRLGVL